MRRIGEPGSRFRSICRAIEESPLPTASDPRDPDFAMVDEEESILINIWTCLRTDELDY